MGTTNSDFPLWGISSFITISLKNQPFFCRNLRNFGWKYLKIIGNAFSKFFTKRSHFLAIFVFFRVIFATRMKKYLEKKSPLTDPTWKARLPVKQGFFFFLVALAHSYLLPFSKSLMSPCPYEILISRSASTSMNNIYSIKNYQEYFTKLKISQ